MIAHPEDTNLVVPEEAEAASGEDAGSSTEPGAAEPEAVAGQAGEVSQEPEAAAESPSDEPEAGAEAPSDAPEADAGSAEPVASEGSSGPAEPVGAAETAPVSVAAPVEATAEAPSIPTEPESAAEAEAPEADTGGIPTEADAFQEGRVWYVIHTYSGHENKVRTNLQHRIQSLDAQDLIFRVVVPTEDEIEIREGQRKTVQRKIFPGYILVQMVELKEDDAASNQAWFVVRNTPGVTGFVGSGTRPVPLEEAEVLRILRQMRLEEPKVKVGFVIGQSVRIVDGPFQDFVGAVDEINVEKGKVKVLVSFFGRETPVELDFLQVEKL
jgi:transcriptional antiterminator NusG